MRPAEIATRERERERERERTLYTMLDELMIG